MVRDMRDMRGKGRRADGNGCVICVICVVRVAGPTEMVRDMRGMRGKSPSG
jgi:hypothetical protein